MSTWKSPIEGPIPLNYDHLTKNGLWAVCLKEDYEYEADLSSNYLSDFYNDFHTLGQGRFVYHEVTFGISLDSHRDYWTVQCQPMVFSFDSLQSVSVPGVGVFLGQDPDEDLGMIIESSETGVKTAEPIFLGSLMLDSPCKSNQCIVIPPIRLPVSLYFEQGERILTL